MAYVNLQNYGNYQAVFTWQNFVIMRTFRYKYKSTTQYSIRDEFEKKGIETRPLEEITIEKEYEKLEKVHDAN